jgi:hypothetical protein
MGLASFREVEEADKPRLAPETAKFHPNGIDFSRTTGKFRQF